MHKGTLGAQAELCHAPRDASASSTLNSRNSSPATHSINTTRHTATPAAARYAHRLPWPRHVQGISCQQLSSRASIAPARLLAADVRLVEGSLAQGKLRPGSGVARLLRNARLRIGGEGLLARLLLS